MSARRVSSASAVLAEAELTNVRLGHENLGSLSVSSGFVPVRPPDRQFPQSHRPWDEAAEQLPRLYAELQIRTALQRMPVLSAEPSSLPDSALLRAATVLGMLGQACVHMLTTADPHLPASIAVPWAEVRRRLGRSPEPVLNYADLIVNNWCTVNTDASAQHQRGPTHLNPHNPALRVGNLRLLVPSVDNQEEQVFHLTQLEILARCAPVVAAVCRAQDAVLNRCPDQLSEALGTMQIALNDVNRRALKLIDPRPRSATFVDPVVWAKTVAPFAVPSRPGVLGPSGTASPIINLLDAFFGRDVHSSQLGREILAHRRSYPPHWRRFIRSVEQVSMGTHLVRSGDSALVEQFESVREAYAGEDGFLGRHRRKVYGYLSIGFMVGRGVTIGGFSGSPQQRRWDDVDAALTASQKERISQQEGLSQRERMSQRERLTGDQQRDRSDRASSGAGSEERWQASAERGGPGDGVTVSELVEHNDDERGWWIALDGRVHDLTGFLQRHPGGLEVIRAHAGIEAGCAFRRAHRDQPAVGRLRGTLDVGSLNLPTAGCATHRAWVDAAFAVVELQNAFRLDHSFVSGTELADPLGSRATAFELDRAADTLARFRDHYLPELAARVLWPLSALTDSDVPTAELREPSPVAAFDSVVANDSVPTPAVAESLRRDLADVENLLALTKSILVQGLRRYESESLLSAECRRQTVRSLVRAGQQLSSQAVNRG